MSSGRRGEVVDTSRDQQEPIVGERLSSTLPSPADNPKQHRCGSPHLVHSGAHSSLGTQAPRRSRPSKKRPGDPQHLGGRLTDAQVAPPCDCRLGRGAHIGESAPTLEPLVYERPKRELIGTVLREAEDLNAQRSRTESEIVRPHPSEGRPAA